MTALHPTLNGRPRHSNEAALLQPQERAPEPHQGVLSEQALKLDATDPIAEVADQVADHVIFQVERMTPVEVHLSAILHVLSITYLSTAICEFSKTWPYRYPRENTGCILNLLEILTVSCLQGERPGLMRKLTVARILQHAPTHPKHLFSRALGLRGHPETLLVVDRLGGGLEGVDMDHVRAPAEDHLCASPHLIERLTGQPHHEVRVDVRYAPIPRLTDHRLNSMGIRFEAIHVIQQTSL